MEKSALVFGVLFVMVTFLIVAGIANAYTYQKVFRTETDFVIGSFNNVQYNFDFKFHNCGPTVYKYGGYFDDVPNQSSGYGYWYGCTVNQSCYNSSCSNRLTWPGSVHTEGHCLLSGGTILYDGSYGYFCRFNTQYCPSGWTQAANYQSYSCTNCYGGDGCGNYKWDCPTSFGNTLCIQYYQGSLYVEHYSCGSYTGYWHSSSSSTAHIYYINSQYAALDTYRNFIGCY